jgi:hypothetical protein
MKKSKTDPFKVRSRSNKPKKPKPPEKITVAQRRAELLAELEALDEGDQSIKELTDRGLELIRHIAAVKDLYKELDEITEALVGTGETEFESTEGIILTLVDNFADKNKQWKSVPFKRFTLELTK